MEALNHWKKLMNPNYLGSWDFQPNEERTVEIIEVKQETIVGDGGRKAKKPVAYLKGQPKPMILNNTNSKILARMYGTPFVEYWVGKKFVLHVEMIKDTAGEMVEALRVIPGETQLPELTPKHPKWNEAVKALKGGKSIDAITSRYALSVENRELLISEAI